MATIGILFTLRGEAPDGSAYLVDGFCDLAGGSQCSTWAAQLHHKIHATPGEPKARPKCVNGRLRRPGRQHSFRLLRRWTSAFAHTEPLQLASWSVKDTASRTTKWGRSQ